MGATGFPVHAFSAKQQGGKKAGSKNKAFPCARENDWQSQCHPVATDANEDEG
jgi:hypothetical protein